MKSQLMNFSVSEIKALAMEVRSFSAQYDTAFSSMLHRRQPDFCAIIDEVGMDPRCLRAHRFCTMFCALALGYAEGAAGCRLPKYPGGAIQEAAGFMARGEEAQIGKRACGYPKRILRHGLTHDEFDEDDAAWLCTTISAFLFLVERSLGRKR